MFFFLPQSYDVYNPKIKKKFFISYFSVSEGISDDVKSPLF